VDLLGDSFGDSSSTPSQTQAQSSGGGFGDFSSFDTGFSQSNGASNDPFGDSSFGSNSQAKPAASNDPFGDSSFGSNSSQAKPAASNDPFGGADVFTPGQFSSFVLSFLFSFFHSLNILFYFSTRAT